MPTVRDYRRENLAALIAEAGTQTELAEQTGLARAFISQVMIGARELGDKAARQIERGLKLGHGALDLPRMQAASYAVREPQAQYGAPAVVTVQHASGVRAFDKTRRIEWQFDESAARAVRRDWLSRRGLHADRCVYYEMRSDNMQPTINRGDLVLINTAGRTPASGEVYAVASGERLLIVRLRRHPGSVLWMHSDHPSQKKHSPEPFDREKSVIAGRVVWREGGV